MLQLHPDQPLADHLHHGCRPNLSPRQTHPSSLPELLRGAFLCPCRGQAGFELVWRLRIGYAAAQRIHQQPRASSRRLQTQPTVTLLDRHARRCLTAWGRIQHQSDKPPAVAPKNSRERPPPDRPDYRSVSRLYVVEASRQNHERFVWPPPPPCVWPPEQNSTRNLHGRADQAKRAGTKDSEAKTLGDQRKAQQSLHRTGLAPWLPDRHRSGRVHRVGHP